MRIVVQRVSEASLEAFEEGARAPVSACAIQDGLVALCGLVDGDVDADLVWMARKLLGLRVFEDDAGKMNTSLEDGDRAVLLVPNFTLAGNCRKGRRPSFDTAMAPERATGAFDRFVELVRAGGVRVETGVFGAHMHLRLLNDGPMTLILDSADRPRD